MPPARRSRTLQQKCTSPRLVILGALIKFVLLPPRLSSAAGHDVAPGVVRESLAIMRVRLNASAAVAGFVPRDPGCLVPVRLIGPGHRALFPAGPESRDRDQCRTLTEGRPEQTIQAGQTRARVGVVQAQKRAGTHPSSVNSRMVANIPLRSPTAHARRAKIGCCFFFSTGNEGGSLERMDQSEEERRANKAQTRELYERDTTLRDSAVDSLRAKIEKVESPTHHSQAPANSRGLAGAAREAGCRANTLDEARLAEEPSD